MPLQNWSRNLTYSTLNIHHPTSIAEIRAIVLHEKNLRVLGTRHSFSTIADSPTALLSTENLTRLLDLDRTNRTVTIEPGVTYGKLGPLLHAEGYALHNLASLPHISIAGAVATATHGSGAQLGNLATAVASFELLTAAGHLLTFHRAHPDFETAAIHLGTLGVVTKLTLDIEPTFQIRQTVYENLPFAQLEENFAAIASAAYSVSLFTDWSSDSINQIWLKHRLISENEKIPAPPPTFFSATAAPTHRHPITALSAENCTPQLNIPGPWHERLPHFRMNFTPSSGDELQSEYFVPRPLAVPALRAINALRTRIAPLLLISELRTIAADNFALSPCFQQDSLALHFTWKPDTPAVLALLPAIESALRPFAVRPHWAKLFTLTPAELQSRYKNLPTFRALAHRLDPAGKFRNPFLNHHLFSKK